MWRAAIIGCGKIAGGYDEQTSMVESCQTHARAFQAISGVQLVGVCDRDPARAQQFAMRWSAAQNFTDPRAMLEQTAPAIVSVCSPTETHADMLELCLSCQGLRAVLCEKPVGFDPSRLSRLLPRFAHAGILLAVNYSRAYAPGIQRWRSLSENCSSVTVEYGKGIFNFGSHALQWVADWLGEITELRIDGSVANAPSCDHAVSARFLAGRTPVTFLPSPDERFDVTFHGDRPLSFFNHAYEVRHGGEAHRTGLETVMRDVMGSLITRLEGGPARLVEGAEALAVLQVCSAMANPL